MKYINLLETYIYTDEIVDFQKSDKVNLLLIGFGFLLIVIVLVFILYIKTKNKKK